MVRGEGGQYVEEGLGNEVCGGYGEPFGELELGGAAFVRDQNWAEKDGPLKTDIPTVNNNTSTFSSPSPLAASTQAFLTSSLTNASPFTNLALPLETYFWMVESSSKAEGERSRNVTVAPFSARLAMEVGNPVSNSEREHLE